MEAGNVQGILRLAILMSTLLYMQKKVSFDPGISFLDALIILLCFGFGYLIFELIIVSHVAFLSGFAFPFVFYTSIYLYYKIRGSLSE